MSDTMINDAPLGGERGNSPSDTAKKLKAYIDAEGLTLSQAALASGIAKSTLSAYLTGNYAGRMDNIDEKAEQYLESQRTQTRMRKAMPKAPNFIETPSALGFRTVFEYAQSGPDIGLITGNAGVGKTETAREYARTTSNVWMMTADSSMRSPTAILRELTETLEANVRRGPRMMASLIQRVTGTGGLIIVDEAQNLTTESIDLLRTIYDRGQIGLVFMGNEPLKGRIEGMGRQSSHAQIFSRVGMRKNRPRPQSSDIYQILDAWGITEMSLRKLCRYIGSQAGGLRSMNKTLKYAFMLAASESREMICVTDIEKAWKSLTQSELPSLANRE
ncbi:AAA family ATPase [Asaia bogorensis]|uniref:AAA family ATPase n=1 Tax=Asaia bogorensis TaxID=91915 RepID=UPI000EFBEF10|nr:AAA family ATPase [Asaia bogorensis]